jgi:hypothetical protein
LSCDGIRSESLVRQEADQPMGGLPAALREGSSFEFLDDQQPIRKFNNKVPNIIIHDTIDEVNQVSITNSTTVEIVGWIQTPYHIDVKSSSQMSQ